jgi:SWI/SNF-related matrix-associated actin-dependent regulator 1 of chromatin subfamily A
VTTKRTLRPFQKDAVAFSSSRETAYFVHDPGLGKTISSVAHSDAVGAGRVLVLCPAHARENWAREVKTWQAKHRPTWIAHGLNQEPPKGCDLVAIASYSNIGDRRSRTLRAALKQDWDQLILDEAQFLKEADSNRTRAVFGAKLGRPLLSLAGRSAHVLALSGTPVPNHAGELYPIVRALYPKAITGRSGTIMSYDQFIRAYCRLQEDDYGYKIVGSKNLRQLKDRLNGFVDIRRKADVLPDLPPLTFATYPLSPHDLPPTDKFVAEELRDAEKSLARRLAAVEDDDLLSCLADAGLQSATERRIIGLAKAPLVAQLITAELQNNTRKMVVFAWHTEVIDRLMELLRLFCPVRIDGRDKSGQKVNSQDTFQADPACRVLVGQITAAGTNFTLTAASDVVFAEQSWVPSDNYQAACRCHRIGQTRGVLARFATLNGSVDDKISRALARKTQETAELFG